MMAARTWDKRRAHLCVERIERQLRARLSDETGGMDEWFARLNRNALHIDPDIRGGQVTIRAPAAHAAWIRAYWMPVLRKIVASAMEVDPEDIWVVLRSLPFKPVGSGDELDAYGRRSWPSLEGLGAVPPERAMERFYADLDRENSSEVMTPARVLEIYDPCRGLLECVYSQMEATERGMVRAALEKRFRTPPPGVVDRQVLHETLRTLEGAPSRLRGRLRTKPRGTVASPKVVLGLAAGWHGVSIDEVCGASRCSVVRFARLTAVHLLRRTTHQTLSQIGRLLEKDHTTIRYTEMQASRLLRRDGEIRANFGHLARESDRRGLWSWACTVAQVCDEGRREA